jgi:ACS family tartrate transporter-like MFS transporter
MMKDLALTPYLYGWAAGIFFLTYTVFEIPSNLILARVGARRWIARIMVTWGLLSILTAIAVGVKSLIALRFLLGVAEAGFFPGIIFYMAQWFPSEYRWRMTVVFFLAVPLSTGLGALVSAPFLAMEGILGLHGWQWLFIAEGLPATVAGVLVYCKLVDRPEDAAWLTEDERRALMAHLESDYRSHSNVVSTFVQAVMDKRVVGLSAIWLLRSICFFGVTFFLPQMISKSFSAGEAAIATAIPSTIGALTTIPWMLSWDRFNDRRWHLVAALLAICVGIGGAALHPGSLFALAGFTLAAIGYSAVTPVLWSIPPTYMKGQASAWWHRTHQRDWLFGWRGRSRGNWLGEGCIWVVRRWTLCAVLAFAARCRPGTARG